MDTATMMSTACIIVLVFAVDWERLGTFFILEENKKTRP